MTQEIIESLQKEKSDLQNQLSDAIEKANDYVFKLDANNQFLGEIVNNCLEVRTAILKLNKLFQEQNQKINNSQSLVASLNTQLTASNAKIAELETKINSLNPAAKMESIEAQKESKSA